MHRNAGANVVEARSSSRWARTAASPLSAQPFTNCPGFPAANPKGASSIGLPSRTASCPWSQSFPSASGRPRYLSEGVDLVVLVVEPSLAAGNAQHLSAQRLESEFHACGQSSVRVLALAPTAAAFSCQIRAPLDVSLPLRLNLPGPPDVHCGPRALPLLATPAVLLSTEQRQGAAELVSAAALMSPADDVAIDFGVVCRVRSSHVSAELLFGVPLMARPPAGPLAPGAASLCRLVSELRGREEALVLSALVCPLRLVPVRSPHFFVAFPVAARGGEINPTVLVMRGVAAADNWQPDALLGAAGASQQYASGRGAWNQGGISTPFATPAQDWPRFDPFQLSSCDDRMVG